MAGTSSVASLADFVCLNPPNSMVPLLYTKKDHKLIVEFDSKKQESV